MNIKIIFHQSNWNKPWGSLLFATCNITTIPAGCPPTIRQIERSTVFSFHIVAAPYETPTPSFNASIDTITASWNKPYNGTEYQVTFKNIELPGNYDKVLRYLPLSSMFMLNILLNLVIFSTTDSQVSFGGLESGYLHEVCVTLTFCQATSPGVRKKCGESYTCKLDYSVAFILCIQYLSWPLLICSFYSTTSRSVCRSSMHLSLTHCTNLIIQLKRVQYAGICKITNEYCMSLIVYKTRLFDSQFTPLRFSYTLWHIVTVPGPVEGFSFNTTDNILSCSWNNSRGTDSVRVDLTTSAIARFLRSLGRSSCKQGDVSWFICCFVKLFMFVDS